MTTAQGQLEAFDVIVIGGGPTGLAACLHLERAGIKRIALSRGDGTRAAGEPALADVSGIVTGGQVDNFTRVSHAHGAAFAAELWRCGDAAFDALHAFCDERGVAFKAKGRIRLVTSEQELVEARRAVDEMRAAGLTARLTERAEGLDAKYTARVLAVQDDGPRGAVLDVAALADALAPAPRVTTLPPVARLDARHDGVRLQLADGRVATCEIAVVAAHLAIGDLIPELREALVAVADQWGAASVPGADAADAGLVYSANHTYEWGAVTGAGRMLLGGGRYLRPMAGIEATTASADAHITQHLLGQLGKTLVDGGAAAAASEARGFLDCRPCDELPVIGPMFGNGRLLVATGYMGNGLSMSFLAGRCLAALVAGGAAPELPRRLWPERLRSLETRS